MQVFIQKMSDLVQLWDYIVKAPVNYFFEGRHFSVLDEEDFTATFYINLLNAANYSSIIHKIVIMITG